MRKGSLMGMVWVGVDVSKYAFYAALADEMAKPRDWASLPTCEFDLSVEGMKAFVRWLREHGVLKRRIAGVCIEATGRYSEHFVLLAKNRLGAISTVNPARPRAFAQSAGIRDKSDRVDACMIALYGKLHEPRATQERSALQRQVRDLSRMRQTFENQYQAHAQRLAESSSPEVRASLKRIMAGLQRESQRLDERMETLIGSDEQLSKDFNRAKSVKGIGPRTAIVIIAEYGDLRGYNRDEIVALAGLYPRDFTSGVSVHKKSKLAKAGKAPVRAALYMCAMSAIRVDGPMRDFARRLEAHNKQPMEIIGAVMRKLLVTVRAVVVTETDYDPNYQNRVPSQMA